MNCTVGRERTVAGQTSLTSHQKIYMKIKRIADFILAAVGLLLLLPLFAVVSIIIKADSPKEPILFKQQRIGLGGMPFTILKFRSMRSTAPSELSTAEFMDAEAYITPLGHVLRNTSIDELPQIINVLRGEMSVIGPRPLILSEEEIHAVRLRSGVYQVCPGLTGLAQVHGRDALNDECKVLWDCRYVADYGFLMDLKVFFLSVDAVLMRRGVIDSRSKKESILALRADKEEDDQVADSQYAVNS